MSKASEFTAFAGLERVSILISMVQETLGYYDREDKVGYELHPCIQSEEEKDLLGAAADSLAELYQKMGEQMVKAEETEQ